MMIAHAKLAVETPPPDPPGPPAIVIVGEKGVKGEKKRGKEGVRRERRGKDGRAGHVLYTFSGVRVPDMSVPENASDRCSAQNHLICGEAIPASPPHHPFFCTFRPIYSFVLAWRLPTGPARGGAASRAGRLLDREARA